MYPGTIALTLTPIVGPVSVASARVKPNTPALLAAYATAPKPPRRPSKLATLIMTGECRPPFSPSASSSPFAPREAKCFRRIKYLVPNINPVKFVPTTPSTTSALVLANNPAWLTPAQFTSTSIFRAPSALSPAPSKVA
jgi:hypothetical protein